MSRASIAIVIGLALCTVTSALAESNLLLEVHRDPAKDALYSRLGNLGSGGEFDWGAPTRIAKARSHGVGFDGSVAVLVYEDDDDDAKLNFRVGVADAKAMTIAWGEPLSFGKGQKPSVKVIGDRVICAYQGSKEDRLWIVVGTIQTERRQVVWGAPVKFEDDGRNVDID